MPPQALHDAEHQQRLQIRRETAQYRTRGEQRQADQEERLAAEALRQIARTGQAYGVGDEIGRHHPGGFVFADAEPAGDIRQRHVGDRGVEHFHEGRECDQDRDQPRIAARVGVRSARSAAHAVHSHARSRS
jgi:hypothetical protein